MNNKSFQKSILYIKTIHTKLDISKRFYILFTIIEAS